MKPPSRCSALPVLVSLLLANAALGQEKPVVGLIPRASKPIKMDGKLDEWDGAFATPVHVGHPDFANRGGVFYFLWDEKALYVGLKCLDRKPAHVAPDSRLYDGDAVEFYLDTRRGKELGAASFGPGTLHMFWTAFTGTEVRPRLRVRDLPAFKGFTLKGAEVAAAKDRLGLDGGVPAALGQLPRLHPQGRGAARHRLRAVQQRRRAAGGPHLRLLVAGQRRLARLLR
jgi:hypothetical protein